MRIVRLELKDIGPFEDAVLEFPEPAGAGELVLFEGPNGCGKTTIAQAIAVAVDPERSSLGEAQLKRRGRSEKMLCLLSFEHNGLRHDERIDKAFRGSTLMGRLPELYPSKHPSTSAGTASVQFASIPWAAFAYKGHAPTANLDASGPRPLHEPPLKGSLNFAGIASEKLGQFLINTEYDRIQAKSYAEERSNPEERIHYQKIAAARQQSLARFENALSTVLDRKVSLTFPMGMHAPRILFDGEEIPIDMLGEGMRNTLSWLSDLIVRLERVEWADQSRSPFDQDFWLILDEIEESLHPRMQARLLPMLIKLFPNARIYATTHSPFIVASVGEGSVFRLRPDPKTRKLKGKIEALALEHGRSLEWVVSEIFSAPSDFVDSETIEKLEKHLRFINQLRKNQAIPWNEFLALRAWLLGLNDEVRTVVSMREVPVFEKIQAKLKEMAA